MGALDKVQQGVVYELECPLNKEYLKKIFKDNVVDYIDIVDGITDTGVDKSRYTVTGVEDYIVHTVDYTDFPIDFSMDELVAQNTLVTLVGMF